MLTAHPDPIVIVFVHIDWQSSHLVEYQVFFIFCDKSQVGISQKVVVKNLSIQGFVAAYFFLIWFKDRDNFSFYIIDIEILLAHIRIYRVELKEVLLPRKVKIRIFKQANHIYIFIMKNK
jgi:hypothetical protein